MMNWRDYIPGSGMERTQSSTLNLPAPPAPSWREARRTSDPMDDLKVGIQAIQRQLMRLTGQDQTKAKGSVVKPK